VAGGRAAFALAFVMAGGGESVMWLRVEDEDIDTAELLRVMVSESTTGSGKKRRTLFVCTGTLHKDKDDRVVGGYARAEKKMKTDPRNDDGLQLELQHDGELPEAEEGTRGRSWMSRRSTARLWHPPWSSLRCRSCTSRS